MFLKGVGNTSYTEAGGEEERINTDGIFKLQGKEGDNNFFETLVFLFFSN